MPVKKRSAPAPAKPRAPLKQQDLSAVEAVNLLANLGYKVTPPSPDEIQRKLAETPDALGIIEHEAKAKPPYTLKVSNKQLWLDLTFAHNINGTYYGPGRTYISPRIPRYHELVQELLYKDQLCKAQEARFFESTSLCHLIVKQRDVAGREAAVGRPVPGDFFDRGDLNGATVFDEFSNASIRR